MAARAYFDTQIAEFEQAVKTLWDTAPREFCLLQTEYRLEALPLPARRGLGGYLLRPARRQSRKTERHSRMPFSAS
jgi:hypothetical protein